MPSSAWRRPSTPAGHLVAAADAAREALELGESRGRRTLVTAYADRLAALVAPDDATRRALDAIRGLLDGDGSTPGAPGSAAPDESWEPVSEPSETDGATAAEPLNLGLALGAAAEAALEAGDLDAARHGLLAAARSHRRAGRLVAAVDACYLAVGLAPFDPELHLLLVELYLDRGWLNQATDKVLLLDRLARLDGNEELHRQVCDVVRERLADEPRAAALCA